MAAVTGHEFYQGDNSISVNMDFEAYVKERLTWSQEKWINEGEGSSKMKTFINSIRFWGKKLCKSMQPKNVVITLFDAPGDISQYLTEIVDAILLFGDNIQLAGFSTFRNTRYVALYFKNEQMKVWVENNLKVVNGKFVAFLTWASVSAVKNVRIKWVPFHVDIENLREEISKYFMIKEENREQRVFMNGISLPSGVVNFKALLRADIDINDIPQITEIDGFEALLSVQGRQIKCFTCKRKGHKAKNCKEEFCINCDRIMLKSHECKNLEDRMETLAGGIGDEVRQDIKTDFQNISAVVDGKQALKLEENGYSEELILNKEAPILLQVNETSDFVVIEECKDEGRGGLTAFNTLTENKSVGCCSSNKSDREAGGRNFLGEQSKRGCQENEASSLSEESNDEGNMDSGDIAIGLVKNYIAELNVFRSVDTSNNTELSDFIKDASVEIRDLNVKKKAKMDQKNNKFEAKDKATKKLSKYDNKVPNLVAQEIKKSYGKKGGGIVAKTSELLFDAVMDKG